MLSRAALLLVGLLSWLPAQAQSTNPPSATGATLPVAASNLTFTTPDQLTITLQNRGMFEAFAGDYHASGLATTWSVTMADSSHATITTPNDFANGMSIMIPKAGPTVSGSPVVSATVNGTTGSTTYAYQAKCLDSTGGGYSAVSAASTVTTGNATLSAANNNSVALSGCPFGYALYHSLVSGCASSCTLYATYPSNQQVASVTISNAGSGCPNSASTTATLSDPSISYTRAAALTVTVSGGIVTAASVANGGIYEGLQPATLQGDVTGANCTTNPVFSVTWSQATTTFIDTGFNNSGPLPAWLPTTVTAGAVRDWCVSPVTSGGGTATLTLGTPCTVAASGAQTAKHADDPAFNAAVANSGNYLIGCGTYNLFQTIKLAIANVILQGAGPCTVLSPQGTQDVFWMTGAIHNQTNGLYLRDFYLGGAPALGKAIYQNWAAKGEMSRIQVLGTINNSVFDGIYSFNSDSMIADHTRVLFPEYQAFNCFQITADAAETNHGIWSANDIKCFGNAGSGDLTTQAFGVHLVGNIATFNCDNCQMEKVEGNSWQTDNAIGGTSAPFDLNCYQCTGEFPTAFNVNLLAGSKLHFYGSNFGNAGFGPNFLTCATSANVNVAAGVNDVAFKGGTNDLASGDGIASAGTNVVIDFDNVYSNSNSGANQGGTAGNCTGVHLLAAASYTYVGGQIGSQDHPTWQANCGLLDSGAANYTFKQGCGGNVINSIVSNSGNGLAVDLGAFTIAGLPACSSSYTDATARVTNGVASPTYLGAVSTTGSTRDRVTCNGSGWVYN